MHTGTHILSQILEFILEKKLVVLSTIYFSERYRLNLLTLHKFLKSLIMLSVDSELSKNQ